MTLDPSWPPLIHYYLGAALLLGLLSTAALLLGRRAKLRAKKDGPSRPNLRPRESIGTWSLAVALLIPSAGTVVFGISRFHYVYDDFSLLVPSMECPMTMG